VNLELVNDTPFMDASQAPSAKRARVDEDGTVASNEKDETPLGPWEADSCSAVIFRLVRDETHVREQRSTTDAFGPSFTHQVFGENERIYGYRGLKIDIYMHCVTFHVLVEISYTEKVKSGILDRHSHRQADDIEAKLKDVFTAGFTTDREEFINMLPLYNTAAASLPPTATLLAEGPKAETCNSWRVVRLKLGSDAPEQILQMHSRLEPMVLFYIDGASAIDGDDPRWDLLLLVTSDDEGNSAVAGFCTVYRFYAYPDSQRMRVSQFLVLPPYQGIGLGTHLLEAVYAMARLDNALDVTLEDPTPGLRMMRNRVELKAATLAPSMAAAVDAAVAQCVSTSQEPKATGASCFDIPAELLKQARCELKMTKVQTLKCWEALLYTALVKKQVCSIRGGLFCI